MTNSGLYKLTFIHFCVKAVLLYKLVMTSLLDYIAVLHNEDNIRLHNGRESVGNDEAGPALHHG